jgi:hypothetical protein
VLAISNELLDEALAMIRAAAFEPNIARSRHWKISWVDRRGRTRLLVVAFTPGGRKARAAVARHPAEAAGVMTFIADENIAKRVASLIRRTVIAE